MFRALTAKRLADGVVSQINAAIEKGAYRPGDRLLSEHEMMKAFGVSRTTVREALLRLQQQGLIEIQHGRRARVAEPSLRNEMKSVLAAALTVQPERLIEDLKETRLALEVAMAARAAEIATARDVNRLMAALDANQRAISSSEAYLRTDIAFHQTVASITGNAIFVEVTGAILQWLARFGRDMVHVKGANLLSHDEHAAIARAIAARDPDAAAKAMRRHQTRSNALYTQLLEKEGRARSKRQARMAETSASKNRRKQ